PSRPRFPARTLRRRALPGPPSSDHPPPVPRRCAPPDTTPATAPPTKSPCRTAPQTAASDPPWRPDARSPGVLGLFVRCVEPGPCGPKQSPVPPHEKTSRLKQGPFPPTRFCCRTILSPMTPSDFLRRVQPFLLNTLSTHPV